MTTSRPARGLLWSAAVFAAVSPLLRAEEKKIAEPPPAVPVEQRGLTVGQRAPSFAANDQFGHRRDLASLMGPRGLVLLFVRSADW